MPITIDRTHTLMLARTYYRFFIGTYFDSPATAEKAYNMVKAGDDSAVKQFSNSYHDFNGADPAELSQYLTSELFPALQEENRRNYDKMLYYADAVGVLKKDRTKAQNAYLIDLTMDQGLYYRYVGYRPKEPTEDSLELGSAIIERLRESAGVTPDDFSDKKISKRTARALFAFIEKEALRGRHWSKSYQSPDTDVMIYAPDALTTNDEGGAFYETIDGQRLEVEPGFDILPFGDDLSNGFVKFCNRLASQLNHAKRDKKGTIIPLKEAEINENRVITETVDDYAEWIGKDQKEARKELRMVTLALQNSRIIINDHGQRKLVSVGGALNVGDGDTDTDRDECKKVIPKQLQELSKKTGYAIMDPIQNGAVTFSFGYDLAEYLSRKYIVALPDQFGHINSHKYPNARHIIYKLCTYYNTSKSYNNAVTNRISIKELLKACTKIPSYQTVKDKRARRYSTYIMEPLERDLDALQDVYGMIRWHYCKQNGERVPDDELGGMKYADWIKWEVWFELVDYDDEPLNAAAERTKNRNKARKAATNSKKKADK